MTPQYQFNLGQTNPLLSIAQNNPEGYISVIEQELQKLNNIKQQLIQAKQPAQQNINNQVSTMHHTADNGKVCKGEIYNYDCAKNVFDKYVRNINSSITVWDVYVAINAQYHDYVRLYSEWFRNINKNELDNKIIESAITFYFKDEDSGSTKTWNYFKTAN